MGKFVIACYKPKDGKDGELLNVIKDHMPVLRKEGLVTDRVCYAMKSKDGCIIEVFEWKSDEAVAEAHKNKNVLALWERFSKVCEYIPLSGIDETQNIFPHFEPIDIDKN